STSSASSEPQAASATVAKAAAERPTKLRRLGAKGKVRGVVIAVSSSGSVPRPVGAARVKLFDPVLQVRRHGIPHVTVEVPDRAGRSVSRELLCPAAVPGSCRDIRQAVVAGLNLTADVALVKNFTKTRRHPPTPLRFGCGPAATRKIARQQESSPPRGGDAPRSQSCNFSSTRAESFGHTG